MFKCVPYYKVNKIIIIFTFGKQNLTMNAIRDNIIIRNVKASKESPQIIVPPVFRKKMESYEKGKVITCGPGTQRVIMPVEKGDTVIFSKDKGQEIQYKGRELKVIKPSHVIAVL